MEFLRGTWSGTHQQTDFGLVAAIARTKIRYVPIHGVQPAISPNHYSNIQCVGTPPLWHVKGCTAALTGASSVGS